MNFILSIIKINIHELIFIFGYIPAMKLGEFTLSDIG